MRYIKIDDAREGMIVAKSIYDKERVCMLAVNKELTVSLISKMKQLGYDGVFVYDEYSDYEELGQILSEDRRTEIIKSLKKMEIDQVLYFSAELTEQIEHIPDLCVDMHNLRGYSYTTYEHSVNVSLLATACGIGLGLSNQNLKELTAAALLHDIGKTKIPDAVLNKREPLTEEEWKLIREHPKIGYEMLCQDTVSLPPSIRTGVLLHHENQDGSGYPFGYHDEQISLYAKIIHVADVYEALYAKRPYKKHYSPSECVEYLMANCGTLFQKDIVDVFLNYLVIYPVGTRVLLSNGKVARVLKNRGSFPLRPKVITVDKEILDLAEDRNLYSITIVQEDGEISIEKEKERKERKD